jgi:hypothetical protein
MKTERKNRLHFRKSSYSPSQIYCVGVCFNKGNVLVTNTKLKSPKTLEFTESEWRAFILGVKNNEFDL